MFVNVFYEAGFQVIFDINVPSLTRWSQEEALIFHMLMCFFSGFVVIFCDYLPSHRHLAEYCKLIF